MAGILEFGIPELNVPFVINQFARSTYNPDSVPYTTDIRALKATFVLTPGASLKVGDVVQESGVTANDFRNPVVYTVVAEDGKTLQTYTARLIATLDPKAVRWERISAEGFGGFQDVSTAVFLNRIYAAAYTPGTPSTGGIYHSTNGSTWLRAKAADDKKDSLPLAAHGRLVTFKDTLWLMGGLVKDAVQNKIWSTTDGEKWTLYPAAGTTDRWSPRERMNAIVFDGKLWVIGGNLFPPGGDPNQPGTALNDVWSSTDGRTWTKVTDAAAFPARSNPAVFIFRNKMWLTGGIDNNKQYLNDVWSSADGVTWTKVTTQTPPPLREGHKVLVNKEQLLLIGGANAGTAHGDLWVSADDGVTWAQITDPADSRVLPAEFVKRAHFDAFTAGKTIWILGGLDGGAPVKEVWRGLMN